MANLVASGKLAKLERKIASGTLAKLRLQQAGRGTLTKLERKIASGTLATLERRVQQAERAGRKNSGSGHLTTAALATPLPERPSRGDRGLPGRRKGGRAQAELQPPNPKYVSMPMAGLPDP